MQFRSQLSSKGEHRETNGFMEMQPHCLSLKPVCWYMTCNPIVLPGKKFWGVLKERCISEKSRMQSHEGRKFTQTRTVQILGAGGGREGKYSQFGLP